MTGASMGWRNRLRNQQIPEVSIASPSIACVYDNRPVADFAELTPPTPAISFIQGFVAFTDPFHIRPFLGGSKP